MKSSRKSALILAGAVASAVLLAPGAVAEPICEQTDAQSICITNGSTSIKSRPLTTAPRANEPAISGLGMPGDN